jgi:hypothetical protein
MEKKEYLCKVKDTLNEMAEIIETTPYDLLSFSDRDAEKNYIDSKTASFDITKKLLDPDGSDGIIVITDNSRYAISPVFIHDDAFVKLFKYIYNGEKHFCKPDIIEYYNNLGNILIRVVNNNGVIGFDSYIPETISEYQVRELEKITRELSGVYKEFYDIDDMNANNIKYGIRTIQDAIKDGKIVKSLNR